MLLLLGSAFAKAQSLDELLPVIQEEDRMINDTLDRAYDDRKVDVTYLEEDLRKVYTGSDYKYLIIEDESENFLSGFFNGIFDFSSFKYFTYNFIFIVKFITKIILITFNVKIRCKN